LKPVAITLICMNVRKRRSPGDIRKFLKTLDHDYRTTIILLQEAQGIHTCFNSTRGHRYRHQFLADPQNPDLAFLIPKSVSTSREFRGLISGDDRFVNAMVLGDTVIFNAHLLYVDGTERCIDLFENSIKHIYIYISVVILAQVRL